MKILLTHPNFPGQFKHLLNRLAADHDNDIYFITNPKTESISGIKKIHLKKTPGAHANTHHYLSLAEAAVYRGQEVFRACLSLKDAGWTPDIILSHPGWGDGLFLKDIYPDTPLLCFLEYYYRAYGADIHFLPSKKTDAFTAPRIRMKNAHHILNLEVCDWGYCPTKWQYSLHPKEFQHKMSVLPDGTDTQTACPMPGRTVKLANGVELTEADEVITYIARNLEPYRGFPQFMQALEVILSARPNAHVIIVGGHGASYSPPPPKELGKNWKEVMLKSISVDLKRVHFTGFISYADMIDIMRISSVHAYLSIPFVLSWSLLDAMSVGCLVVGSDVPPVREVIEEGQTGLLVEMRDPQKIAERIIYALERQDTLRHLRTNARKLILERYDLNDVLPLQVSLIQDLASGQTPPPTAAKLASLYPIK